MSISDDTTILSVDLEKLKKESVLELYEDKEKFVQIAQGLGLKTSFLRLKPLAVVFSRHAYPRGSVIYSQRDSASDLVLLTSGEVELMSRKKDQPTKERLGSKYRLRSQLSPFLVKGNHRVSHVCLVSAGQLLGEETVLKLPRHLCEAVVVSETATAFKVKREHLDRLFSLLTEEGLHLKFIESCERKVEMIEKRLQKLENSSAAAAVSAMSTSNIAGALPPKQPSLPNIRFNFKQAPDRTQELSIDIKIKLKNLIKRSTEGLGPKMLRPKRNPEARQSSKDCSSISESLQAAEKKKSTSILASMSRKDSGVMSPSMSKYPEKSSMSTFSASKSVMKNRSLEELFRIAKQPIAVQLNTGPVHSPLLSTGRVLLLDQAASPHTGKKRPNHFCLHMS